MRFSDEVLLKAEKLKENGHVERSVLAQRKNASWAKFSSWRVRSSDELSLYFVETDFDPFTRKFDTITCSCRHGQAAGGRSSCSHAAVVLMVIRDELTGPNPVFDPNCPRCDANEHTCPGCGDDVPHNQVACEECRS